ncbi:flagellar biosynthesis protein FlhB [Aciditerrimonas ferrireducens]|uniref:Flagellar biosynthesis protein FlhB n=1 Tax=Aciditerrimonas ferrireducens TaxID=667306 RepID=A0ABV6C534_9ACTN
MARRDERTEKPTPKRRREARQEGQIAKTPELAGWLAVLVASMALPAAFGYGERRVVGVLAQANHVMADPTSAGALAVLRTGLVAAAEIVLPVAGVMAAVSLVVTAAQVGPVLAWKAARPQFSRLNPLTGIKRLFSAQSLWMLAKEVLKLAVIGALAYRTMDAMVRLMLGAQLTGIGPAVAYAGGALVGLVRQVALAGLVLAGFDYAFQRRRVGQQLKMTKQEVKEEFRQHEGDPLLKGQIRKKQRALSRLRMMAAVAKADVVVTNPTHVAVALRYEPGSGQAPRVVAKGADHLAARIREEARRHGVPVVEDPPLARALHAACDLDDLVPVELYLAVARLLAFVFTLPDVVRRSGRVHRRPVSAMVA